MFTGKRQTRLRTFEQLEPRWLMAGNVTVSVETVVRGHFEIEVLAIVGDNASNQVRVTDQGVEGVLVQGLNGTTINGAAADQVFETGLGEVNLGDGNDSFEYVESDTGTTGIVNIDTGNGNDHVLIKAGGYKAGTFRIDTGRGDDSVSIDYSRSASVGGFTIQTGNGNDAVDLRFGELDSLPYLYSGSPSSL
jgi:hypothetical protein